MMISSIESNDSAAQNFLAVEVMIRFTEEEDKKMMPKESCDP